MKNTLSELSADLSGTKIQYGKINILFLLQVLVSENYSEIYKGVSLINFAKKFGLENTLKFLSYKISSPLRKKRNQLKFDYLFVNEVNNAPVIQTLNLVYKEFSSENVGLVFSDKRIVKQDEKSINIFSFITFSVLLKSIINFIGLWPSFFKYQKDIRFISEKYNISRLYVVLNCFDSIFMINVVSNLLLKLSASKIVLMTDVHKLSRILTIQSKELGIPTFVIQHGATVGEAGYLPIIADKMLVWGESSKNWFIDRGQPREKLEITGSPRMDSILYQESHTQPKQWSKALIIMSEIATEEEFLMTIRDAFMKSAPEGLKLIIKLHPGITVDYSFMLERVFQQSGLSYQIMRFENTNLLLKETDVVFVTNSSVGMEAVTNNKPLFQFKSRKYFNHRMSYEDFNCSHVFETSEQLCEMLSKRDLVYSKLHNYFSFVNYYFGKLDGNSSRRIKDYIAGYQQSSN